MFPLTCTTSSNVSKQLILYPEACYTFRSSSCSINMFNVQRMFIHKHQQVFFYHLQSQGGNLRDAVTWFYTTAFQTLSQTNLCLTSIWPIHPSFYNIPQFIKSPIRPSSCINYPLEPSVGFIASHPPALPLLTCWARVSCSHSGAAAGSPVCHPGWRRSPGVQRWLAGTEGARWPSPRIPSARVEEVRPPLSLQPLRPAEKPSPSLQAHTRPDLSATLEKNDDNDFYILLNVLCYLSICQTDNKTWTIKRSS